jgi:hypothetical protein
MEALFQLVRTIAATPGGDLLWLGGLGMIGVLAAAGVMRIWESVGPRFPGPQRVLGRDPLEGAGPVARAALWGVLCLALLGVVLVVHTRMGGR